MSENANDIIIYCRSGDLQHVKSKIQDQIYLFLAWTKTWRPQLNQNKTKAMLFARKNISTSTIKISNIQQT